MRRWKFRLLAGLTAAAGEKEFKLARKLAEKAESSCMITRAIQGNVAVELEADITTA